MTVKPADLDHLLDQARTDLQGVTDAALKGALFDVLGEFFDETSAWQEQIPVAILPDTQTYSISPSDGGQILRLVYVLDQNNIPQPAYLAASRDTVVLQRVYNSPATFIVTVVKTVSFPTDKKGTPIIPDTMLATYGVIILHGLKGTLMRHNAMPYTNAPLSSFHLQKFLDGKKRVATDVQRAFTHGGQLWSFPRNFAVSSQRSSISTAFPRT